MKKSTFMLGVASFAMLAFVSCKKSETVSSFEATTVPFEVVDEDRAYLGDNNRINFELGDVVKMFNISEDDATISECADYVTKDAGTTVHFKPLEQMTVTSKGSFYSFFPAENVTPDLANENRATFEVSAVQDYYEVNGKPSFSKKDMYMASQNKRVNNINNVTFKFQSIMGVMRLKYFTTGDVNTIKNIKVVDKAFALTGDVNLMVDKVTSDGLTAMCNNYDPSNPDASATAIADYKEMIGYNVTNKGNVVTLDFGENGYTLSDDATNPSVFYIVLRPLALAHGYQVIITTMDDVEHVVVDRDGPQPTKKMVPNKIIGSSAIDLNDLL